MKKLMAVLSVFALLLCGCSEQKNEQVNYPDSDMAWNKLNIMETENGYYIKGNTSTLFLRYHDKKTGNEIMLCNKAECPHDGRETCTATYKDMPVSNIVLYNNALYFAGVESDEENITVSLYKASCDGSALDRICSLYSVKDGTETRMLGLYRSNLLIHRGYAFVNIDLYYIENINQYKGFIGGGYYKIDLRTNEKTVIKTYDDFWDEKFEKGIVIPCGNYIFKTKRDSDKTQFYRCGIDSDAPEEVFTESGQLSIMAADSKTLYVQEFPEDENNKKQQEIKIIEYDPETMEKKAQYTTCEGRFLAYEGKLYISSYNDEKNSITVYENGKKVFETENIPGGCDEYSSISISDGKMYISKQSQPFFISEYWSCKIEDILSENINWKSEYSTDESAQKLDEYIRSKMESGEIYYSFNSF